MRDAAFAILEEVGYDRLQLTEVAARAGVNKTTVYRRWPTKVDLLADLFADLTATDAPIPDSGSLDGDLVVMLGEVAALLDLAAVRAVLRASMTLAEDDQAAVRARAEFWEMRFVRGAQIIHRAVDRGDLPPDTDPRRYLELVFGPLYFRQLVVGDQVDDDYLTLLARQRPTTAATASVRP